MAAVPQQIVLAGEPSGLRLALRCCTSRCIHQHRLSPRWARAQAMLVNGSGSSTNRTRWGAERSPSGATVLHLSMYSPTSPISPVGQGAGDVGEWQRFLNKSYSLGSRAVSVWRYGVAPLDVFANIAYLPGGPGRRRCW